jgi:glutamate synthase (NADPH) small chain
VTQLEIMPAPPANRAADNPWPQWPHVYRVTSAHEEGGERLYATRTTALAGDRSGHVRAVVTDTGRQLPADLVLLAMGFTGVARDALVDELQPRLTPRAAVWRDASWMTSVPGVFVAGDMQRGQSLIVWAMADGRQAAEAIDRYLVGAD